MSVSLLRGGLALARDRVSDRDGRRCAARFDEDAVTLAAEAAQAAVDDRRPSPDALVFASASCPYAEGGNAQLLVELLGMNERTLVVELNATLRDGLCALRLADGLLATGFSSVLVVASHRARQAEPGAGDGAVAMLLAPDGGVARLTPLVAHSEELRDRWRLNGESQLRLADPSFADSLGAARVAGELAEHALAVATRGADRRLPRVAVCCPTPSAAARAERALGGSGDSLVQRTGVLGAAHPLLRLLASLDEPTAVIAASGGLAESLLCEPDPTAAPLAALARDAAAGGRDIDHGAVEFAARDFHPYQSAPRAWRERSQELRLEGLRFGGKLHYPPPAAPPPGHEHETGERVRLARSGTVLTQTRDHVYTGAELTQMVVLDLDDGARFYCQVAAGEDLAIGDRARLVPRRLHDGGNESGTGFIQYFWKAVPCQ